MADTENPTGGPPSDVRPVSITDEMKRSYLDYAMNAVTFASNPSVGASLRDYFTSILASLTTPVHSFSS